MSEDSFSEKIKLFLSPFDARYEDLFNGEKGTTTQVIIRDICAGLIVSMLAIPLSMGFAIASGLAPVHGIIGGAVAGLVGALFGGSKYQVYGATAAYIPSLAAIMALYEQGDPAMYQHAYSILVGVSFVAAAILLVMGLTGMGKYVTMVPHSIVVGFTIGIGVTIFMSEIADVLGITAKMPGHFVGKVYTIFTNLNQFNIWCLLMGIATFAITKLILRITIYVPGPIVAVVVCMFFSETLLKDKGMTLIQNKFGHLPNNLFSIAHPSLPPMDSKDFPQFVYSVVGIVLVGAIESLLCSRMADRLAKNEGTPFNPNKELWGQGMVNIFVPLFNGFPHTGALARTATNIKVGAVTPLSGIFMCVWTVTFALLFKYYLERIPMACIGGILVFVASNMVSPKEINEVLETGNRFHIFLMAYSAVMVILTDFSTGVVSAIIIYFALRNYLDTDFTTTVESPHSHTRKRRLSLEETDPLLPTQAAQTLIFPDQEPLRGAETL